MCFSYIYNVCPKRFSSDIYLRICTRVNIEKRGETRIGPHSAYLARAVSRGVKQTGREADHLPPSSANVKNCGAIPPLLLTPSWRSASFIKEKDNFTVYPLNQSLSRLIDFS
jgi:hypothetical protein